MKSGIEYLKQSHEELIEATPATKANISEIAIAVHAQTLQKIYVDKQAEELMKGVTSMFEDNENIFSMLRKGMIKNIPDGTIMEDIVIILGGPVDKNKFASFSEKIHELLIKECYGVILGLSSELNNIPLSIDINKKKLIEADIITMNTKENFNYQIIFEYGDGPIREQTEEK